MGRIELDAFAIREKARSAHKRDVMKMDHVKTVLKNFADPSPVDRGLAQLLRCEAGYDRYFATQAVHDEALGLSERFPLHAT
jgi:hypothetical protein